MDSKLHQYLAGCSAPEPSIRQFAENALAHAEESNFESFVVDLTIELGNVACPTHIRQLAGLLLKNATSAKDKNLDATKVNLWKNLNPSVQTTTRNCILLTLQDEDINVQRAGAQVLSKIGRIDLPANSWPGLFPALIKMTNAEEPVHMKRGALTAIAYLCEDLNDHLEDVAEENMLNESQCNSILQATIQGMRDQNIDIRIAATKAFYHAVLFAASSFENEVERNFIFEVICTSLASAASSETSYQSEMLQICCFEVLVQIGTLYYGYLEPYMNVIGHLSWAAIEAGVDSIAIPAIEFWNTICDAEIELQNAENVPSPTRTSRGFTKQAQPYLLPILLESLTKQESEDSIDTWTLSMAAGICLSLCAQVLKDAVVDDVLAFVNKNVADPLWNRREAAVLAFGSILEGPSFNRIHGLAAHAFPNLMSLMSDRSPAVRDTAIWAIGRIISVDGSIALPCIGAPSEEDIQGEPCSQPFGPNRGLIGFLVDTLRFYRNSKSTVTCCWVLSELWENLSGNIIHLDPWFVPLFKSLCAVAENHNTPENRHVREAAYNALSSLVAVTSNVEFLEDILKHFILKLTVACEKLEVLKSTCASRDHSGFLIMEEDLIGLQNSYCVCLQSLVKRTDLKFLPSYANPLWTALQKVLSAGFNSKGALSEEALLTVACLVRACRKEMAEFTSQLITVVDFGLKNPESPECVEVYRMSVDLVADLTRCGGQWILPFAENLLTGFYNTLLDPKTQRSLKPHIFVAIGDIAMGMKSDFRSFFPSFMDLLGQAANTRLSDGPEDVLEWRDFLVELRDSVLQSYIGIIYGMKEGSLELLKPRVNMMLQFIQLVVLQDSKYLNIRTLNYSLALMGDIIAAFGKELHDFLKSGTFLPELGKTGGLFVKDEKYSIADREECETQMKWLSLVLEKV